MLRKVGDMHDLVPWRVDRFGRFHGFCVHFAPIFIEMVKIVLDGHFFVAQYGISELLVVRHWEGLTDIVAYSTISSFSCVPRGTVHNGPPADISKRDFGFLRSIFW